MTQAIKTESVMKKNLTHVTYLSQAPGPYRERMHELISEQKDFTYTVIYCTKLEPDRKWKFNFGNYTKFFLTEASSTYRDNNLKIWRLLNLINPDILIITAFKPTMLYGVVWCLSKRRKLIVLNDGTYESERNYSFIQKLIRKFVYKITDAFLAPGKGTFQLYRSYGVAENKIFKSCLCVDNSQFGYENTENREFHIMFSGQIIDRKMPLFFVEVAKLLKKQIPELRALIVGDGDMREQMLQELEKNGINYKFTGFLDQVTLPSFYSKAKLFLFPTLNDPWGIVANEACASGTPVITCNNAGVSEDLIIHGENGYILPLDVSIWIPQILQLLSNPALLQSFSNTAKKMVEPYTHQQASGGIIKSVEFILSNRAI